MLSDCQKSEKLYQYITHKDNNNLVSLMNKHKHLILINDLFQIYIHDKNIQPIENNNFILFLTKVLNLYQGKMNVITDNLSYLPFSDCILLLDTLNKQIENFHSSLLKEYHLEVIYDTRIKINLLKEFCFQLSFYLIKNMTGKIDSHVFDKLFKNILNGDKDVLEVSYLFNFICKTRLVLNHEQRIWLGRYTSSHLSDFLIQLMDKYAIRGDWNYFLSEIKEVIFYLKTTLKLKNQFFIDILNSKIQILKKRVILNDRNNPYLNTDKKLSDRYVFALKELIHNIKSA